MPVRPTSTRPSSRIKCTNVSILSGPPVISKMKLDDRRIDHAGAEDVGQAHRLDALVAGAGHLDQRQFAFDMRAGIGQVGHFVHRDQPFALRDDLVDHLRADLW